MLTSTSKYCPSSSSSPFHSNVCKRKGATNGWFRTLRGARPLEREALDSPLIGRSRKRTSSDGFALEIRPVQTSQLARNARATALADECRAHVVLCPGTRLRSRSRKPRVPHRTVAGRLLGASLWMERTVHEFLSLMYKDLLTPNEEEQTSTALCRHRLRLRDVGEW